MPGVLNLRKVTLSSCLTYSAPALLLLAACQPKRPLPDLPTVDLARALYRRAIAAAIERDLATLRAR